VHRRLADRAGADARHVQRLPGHLTTARCENVGFYERFGCQVEAEGLALVPDGPTRSATCCGPATGWPFRPDMTLFTISFIL
jgi:hypothetical protein